MRNGFCRRREAFRQEQIATAEGDAARFLAIYKRIQGREGITRKRIYLETMEEILSGMDKVIIDTDGQGSGVVPYLPLNELQKSRSGGRELGPWAEES